MLVVIAQLVVVWIGWTVVSSDATQNMMIALVDISAHYSTSISLQAIIQPVVTNMLMEVKWSMGESVLTNAISQNLRLTGVGYTDKNTGIDSLLCGMMDSYTVTPAHPIRRNWQTTHSQYTRISSSNSHMCGLAVQGCGFRVVRRWQWFNYWMWPKGSSSKSVQSLDWIQHWSCRQHD